MVSAEQFIRMSSKDLRADLPAALRNQVIADSKSVYKKYRKTGIQSILKKPAALWNNQNYSVEFTHIGFPVMVDGKSHKIYVKCTIPEDAQLKIANSKHGTLRITKKNGKYFAQIAISVNEQSPTGNGIVGVDVGLKVPAVAVSNNGSILFAGNGRRNKYIRRHNKSRRRKLGKAKKLNAIKRLENKEQRFMKDADHKVSRMIVNFAIENHSSLIRMEQLTNIRQTAKTSRKNEKNLHSWSFYRLAQFIEYKAKMAGIGVEYVNPAYTSQECPKCGTLNKSKGRSYVCGCGYRNHRDIVGAINILSAPVADGNSLSA